MRAVVLLVLLVSLLPISAVAPIATTAADVDAPDWAVGDVHFFTQAGGTAGKGYPLANDANARFLSAYNSLGRELQLGYPIGDRYEVGDQAHQPFQKAVVRWNKELKQAELLSIFDELSRMGRDTWLWNTYRVPPTANWFADGQKPASEIILVHQAKLEADPAMKEYYFSVPDPLAQFGLPQSDIVDAGDYTVLRTQKAVIQKWKKDVPWATAGSVTVANGGEIARAAGMIPAAALQPLAPEEALGGERWVDVNLTEQTASALVGLKLVYRTFVATGVPGLDTPKGNWKILWRVANETMRGADYYLTGVLFTQYFTTWGVALHYNYWTPDEQFGNRAGSHGCVGMRYDDALFFWEFGEVGMLVNVHD
jgi:lipoprotein-anchoring transpeptidase ErfK/SrfK